jgi:hypothetical protein
MRVNGFSGGRLPPKSQIRQIRFVMNPYAAEFHESQPVFIDVQTKPGLGEWSRTRALGFRDDSLNARSPLAPSRVPDSYRRFGFDLSGPLVKGRTSLNRSLGRADHRHGAHGVRARRTEGGLSQLADSSTDRVDVSARLEHGYGKTHTLQASSRASRGTKRGSASAASICPSAATRRIVARPWRASTDNGVIFGKVASEQRLQHSLRVARLHVQRDPAPSVRVMGAFGAGGAGVTGGRESREIESASNFDLSIGKKHALRAGVLLRDLSVTHDEQRNAAGSFTFADLASYEAGRPSLFTQRTGSPTLDYRLRELGVYVQDEAA